jgi:hypothetical protein
MDIISITSKIISIISNASKYFFISNSNTTLTVELEKLAKVINRFPF